METISSEEITDKVAELFIDANVHIEEAIFDLWVNALKKEEINTQAREIIQVMIKNAWIAWKENLPICQDTGQPVVFVEQGDKVNISGKPLFHAINAGIEKGGAAGYLRKSVVEDPLMRDHEGSYGPAVIHHRIVPGKGLCITLYPAGCGCEQMNSVAMFAPNDEEITIKEFVLRRVKEASSKPCPPNLIGLGIGGDLEESAYLARKALIRPAGTPNDKYAHLEGMLFDEINKLNIGPQGLGGRNTVLCVNIEASSCHRANLPVAIAFNCHIGRSKKWEWPDKEGLRLNKKIEAFKKRLKDAADKIQLFRDWPAVELPLTKERIDQLQAGDKVLLNGFVYTARDAAHRRLARLIEDRKELPFELEGQIIYYVGPTPKRPGHVIGSAGPTTSARMDCYTPLLLSHGLKGMIGKGYRSKEVKEAIKEYGAIYFITFAGAGALLSSHIIKSEMIAFEDLGTEAIRRFELKDFPVIVAHDARGRSVYEAIGGR